MCKELEDMKEEARTEEKLKIAKKMLSDGILSIAQIVNYSGLPESTVTELAKA